MGSYGGNSSLQLHQFANKTSNKKLPQNKQKDDDEEVVKTDESFKDLELDDVIDFYRINDEYMERAKKGGRAAGPQIKLPQMPPSHI